MSASLPGPRAAIVGIAGPSLRPDEAELLQAHPPAGVILFARNIQTPAQLSALITTLRACLPPDADLMVDQEGGRVVRLRPPCWRSHPPALLWGTLFDQDEALGLRAAWLTGALIGADAAAAGFTVVAAPVLDLLLPDAHDVVGDRALHRHPAAVGQLGRAVSDGLLASGVIPVGKHVPGHGRALVDSHLALPRVASRHLDDDIQPFIMNADLPWMMTAHIVYEVFDAFLPATLSRRLIESVIRGRIGYKGVLVSDDLAMQALSDEPCNLARQALAAGCDIALYCSGDFAATEALLRTCPSLTTVARARLKAGRTLLELRRSALDVSALAYERNQLLQSAGVAPSPIP